MKLVSPAPCLPKEKTYNKITFCAAAGFEYMYVFSFYSSGLPSLPRNLRWSVVGAMDLDREYRVFWSASSHTGGLPVNYSVRLCMNDSYAQNNFACKWSSNPDCRPRNVLSTKKDFFCLLMTKDFITPCEKTCNYTLSVVATNDVGSATSWTYLPFIDNYAGNAQTSGSCFCTVAVGV